MSGNPASDAPQVKTQGEGSLLAVIGDEVPPDMPAATAASYTNAQMPTDAVSLWQDTVTGFLLAGVGNIDMRKNKNFLVVSDSKTLALKVAMLLTPHPGTCNTGRTSAETPVRQIEDTLKDYTNREDIAIVLINQHVSHLTLPPAPPPPLLLRYCALTDLCS